VGRIMVTAATGMGLVFATGVIFGIILMVAMAIRREDRRQTLTREPPDAAARAVRRLNRVGLRDITPRDAEDVRR
jgi:hypothetical protein